MATMDQVIEPRTVAFSRISMSELMIPAYANFGGKIHGGILLSLMDKVAYACAAKHAGRYCVTVSVDGVDFLQPVEVGELVTCLASVNYVGRTSMVVGIKVLSESFVTGIAKHTNTSFFTMVAKGDDGKPAVVPELVLEDREQLRRFVEAKKRIELRKSYKSELDDHRTNLVIDEDPDHIVDGERCIVRDGIRRART